MKTKPKKTIRVWRRGADHPEDVVIATERGDLMMNRVRKILLDPDADVELDKEDILAIVSSYVKKSKAMRRKDDTLDRKSDELRAIQERFGDLCLSIISDGSVNDLSPDVRSKVVDALGMLTSERYECCCM